MKDPYRRPPGRRFPWEAAAAFLLIVTAIVWIIVTEATYP